MKPSLFPLGIAAVALVGCTTSAQDVVFEPPSADGEAVSLQTAWAGMEARLNRLEADLARSQAELDALCDTPAASTRAICNRITAVEARAADTASEVDAINPSVDLLAARLEATQTLLAPVSYDARKGSWTLTGVNLQVRNGTGSTAGDGDGTGNIVVGWNEAGEDDVRTGSHNVIVGTGHSWEGHSGLATGTDHLLAGVGAATLGGEGNTVTADDGVVIGGQDNTVAALLGVVVGGVDGDLLDEGWVLLGPIYGPEFLHDEE